jgi:hypothetical protein
MSHPSISTPAHINGKSKRPTPQPRSKTGWPNRVISRWKKGISEALGGNLAVLSAIRPIEPIKGLISHRHITIFPSVV